MKSVYMQVYGKPLIKSAPCPYVDYEALSERLDVSLWGYQPTFWALYPDCSAPIVSDMWAVFTDARNFMIQAIAPNIRAILVTSDSRNLNG